MKPYFAIISFGVFSLFNLAAKAAWVKVLSIQECEPPLNFLDFQVDFQIGEDSIDIMSGILKNPINMSDEDASVTLKADKFVDDKWMKDVFTLKNKPFFPLINLLAGDIWTKFRQQVTPEIEVFDKILAGDYKIEGFKVKYDDIIPIPLSGRYLWTMILTVNDFDAACVGIETES